MKFDDTDVRVLRNLQKDARTNFADIAKECGVSVDTVIKRFQRLQKGGVVKGTTILIDPRHFGLDCLASLEVNVDPASSADMVKAINRAARHSLLYAKHGHAEHIRRRYPRKHERAKQTYSKTSRSYPP